LNEDIALNIFRKLSNFPQYMSRVSKVRFS